MTDNTNLITAFEKAYRRLSPLNHEDRMRDFRTAAIEAKDEVGYVGTLNSVTPALITAAEAIDKEGR